MAITKENDLLWDFDLPHIGALCTRVRHGRGLKPTDIARSCKVSTETITRNIEKERTARRKIFLSYLNALQLDKIKDKPVKLPLAPAQSKILLDLYEDRKQVAKRQCELAAISFEIIKSDYRPTSLSKLVTMLEKVEYPALIVDPLWFVHAVNGALLRLFNMEPDAEHLSRWEGWHSLATKFPIDSPVRDNHHNPDTFFPQDIVYFLQDDCAYPYLFTYQMRMLIYRLFQLSSKHHFKFAGWWLGATSFSLPYDLIFLERTIIYKKQLAKVDVKKVMRQDVVLSPGYVVPFSLAVWEPRDDLTTNKIFEEVCSFPDSQTVFYAADYDEHGDFHVNTWPGVNEKIEGWISEID